MALGGNEQSQHNKHNQEQQEQFNDNNVLEQQEEQLQLEQQLNINNITPIVITTSTTTSTTNNDNNNINSDICLIKNGVTTSANNNNNNIIIDDKIIINDKKNTINNIMNGDDICIRSLDHSDNNINNIEKSIKLTNEQVDDAVTGTVIPAATVAITKQTGNNNNKTSNKQTDANTAFLRAARAGDLLKLIEFIETKQVTDINTCNANGLNALHLAAKDGHIEIVRELLNRGASVDNATKKGNTALHIASLAGQKEVIKLLIQANGNVNVQSQNGFTPLYMAAQENHDTCVRYLLAKGANQTLATEDGFTPLAVAMQQGHDKVVAVLLESDSRGKVRLPALHIAAKKDDCKAATLLLENEHNPDVASKSGFTPLHIAAHYGNVNIAELLLTKNADVNYAAKHNITPLHVACKWGKTNMVQLLIAHGAKLDSTTRDGLTPLHCAARSGHDIVIDMLLENNAPILSKTKNGLAPLHMAAQGEHVDAARILLYHRAPVDEVTVDYLTALHVAAHCGHVRVAKLLLDRNADPNARALNGFTPLHIACKKNRIKVVELLLKHGASISATTESGLTPLHVASFMGCMNIVIYLLQHEASPDVPTVRGETPLHLAARANQTDIIRILLRNGAQVDARAREEQTPLHVASRLGNVDIVMLLLQHGANIDAETKDLYTPLHIAAKEGQDEVSVALIENGAGLNVVTKKGFTPLHLAGKYGNLRVAELLLQKGADVDAQGKNGVTPLHVASHYDNQQVALLLLDKGASPHASAKNGHTPLHIAAKKNQMEIATTLLQYGAQADAESKSGFTPLHLSSQEGHADMSSLLIEHQANANHVAKNGLTPLHLCAQEDEVPVANILLNNGSAKIDATTKSGYTPLHIAAHYGQVNMVRFLLENDAAIEMSTNIGYTPLHQAAQQGQILIINLLLKHKANPNAITNSGQTALNIANRLGYITVVESLKIITETNVVNNTKVTGNIAEEKYKVAAPESIHETFMSDSEDECGEDPIMSDHRQYKYMTVDEMKTVPDDQQMNKLEQRNLTITTTTLGGGSDGDCGSSTGERRPNSIFGDEYTQFNDANRLGYGPNEMIVNQESYTTVDAVAPSANNPFIVHALDNVDIVRNPINVGFLVSFLVDARGGAMRGCRHSGVRVIVPPRSAAQPTRITCRYVRPQRTPNPPPLMEGEALVSRILELGPVGAKFLGPVIIEVPHFASLRGKEREIIILRSDNGETWREHTLFDSEEAIQDVLNDSFEGDELGMLEDLHTNRITRVVTNDFPHFFAVVSRIRQEVHAIGSEGGTVSSTAVPQVQAVFPQNALTKKIRVGLQAQPIDANITAKLLGRGVAVSPVVTVEPRRRKFHKAITLSMPAPRAHRQGMINQYSGNAPTLRLLCSITGGQNRAIWEDVTGSTPLTFVKECVSFTTTVSARFWLMDCRNIGDASKMATELYTHMAHVPFMVKFVVFAKRIDAEEAKLSVFCMTDDKEDKTLEQQEHFTEVAKSCDVEVLEARPIYLEFAGNIIPIMKSGEQISMKFNAFKENRLAFIVRVKDQQDSSGIIGFMNEPRVAKGEASQMPICTLNISLPEKITTEEQNAYEYRGINKIPNFPTLINGDGGGVAGLYASYNKTDEIHKADIRLSDICNLLGADWEKLAHELEVPQGDVDLIKLEYPDRVPQQAMVMLRLWLRQSGKKATGNTIEQALHRIQRSDIVDECIFNLELVTDEMEKAVAKLQLDQSGFDNLKEELGPSRDTSLRRNTTIDRSYCDRDENVDNTKDAGLAKNEGVQNTIDLSHINDTEVLKKQRSLVTAEKIDEQSKIPPTAEPETTDLSLSHQINDLSMEDLSGNETKHNTDVTTIEQDHVMVADDQNGITEIPHQCVKRRSVHEDNKNNSDNSENRKSKQEISENILEDFGVAVDDLMEKVGKTVNVTRDNNNLIAENQMSEDGKIMAIVNENFIQMERNENNNNNNEIFKIRPFGGTTGTIGTEQATLIPSNDITNQISGAAKTSTPIKIKTIKKHSKVPRDLVKNPITVRPAVGNIEWDLAKDRDWDDGGDDDTDDDRKIITEISTLNLEDISCDDQHSIQPTLIISPSDDQIDSGNKDNYKRTINVDATDVINVVASKIPVKVSSAQAESGITMNKRDEINFSPHSRSGRTISSTSCGINSDSDSDSHCESPLDPLSSNRDTGRINQRSGGSGSGICTGDNGSSIGVSSGGRISSKTLGSSSGSDIALHEAGAELSEDETENDFYQQNEQNMSSTNQATSVPVITEHNNYQQQQRPVEQQSTVMNKSSME